MRDAKKSIIWPGVSFDRAVAMFEDFQKTESTRIYYGYGDGVDYVVWETRTTVNVKIDPQHSATVMNGENNEPSC